MSDPAMDGLTEEESEVLEWLRNNGDRLASVADHLLTHQAPAQPPPEADQETTEPSATPAKRHGRPVGDAFVWVSYYGANDDVERASSEISSVIADLQDELEE